MVRVGPIFVRTSHGPTPKLRGEGTRGGTRASVMSVTERLAASIELSHGRQSAHSEGQGHLAEQTETWLGIIPERQRTPEETLEKAVRDQGTPQRPSKPQH
jgi:hypothetical protein